MTEKRDAATDDKPFKYRMILKFDGFERVVEGEYPAPVSTPVVPLAGDVLQHLVWIAETAERNKALSATDLHYLNQARSMLTCAPVSETAPARLVILNRMLERFPTGNDIEGVYGQWKNELDAALKIGELVEPAPVCVAVAPGWVPVEERLPEKPIRRTHYLVIAPDDGFKPECIVVARWTGECFKAAEDNNRIRVTHWMPFPPVEKRHFER